MEEILDEIKKYFKGELRTINQNLKAVSRLIKIQRFFTILAFSLIIWISISSVISMISQNPNKKKIYSYLQGEKGIARIVVYETTENYITQNAKIIENYNGKILILDTRSFCWWGLYKKIKELFYYIFKINFQNTLFWINKKILIYSIIIFKIYTCIN